MERIGFIGEYDKTDCILYVAKIITEVGQKVLIIDSTYRQKLKYLLPPMDASSEKYITEFRGVDIAVGFESFEDIRQYLNAKDNEQLGYDYVFVDIDDISELEDFEMVYSSRLYFVTSLDVYSLKKGLEIFAGSMQTLKLTKVLFSRDMSYQNDQYVNISANGYKIEWNEYRIDFPLDINDIEAIAENQRFSNIRFKKLSKAYIEGLRFLTEDIAKNLNPGKIARAIKSLY